MLKRSRNSSLIHRPPTPALNGGGGFGEAALAPPHDQGTALDEGGDQTARTYVYGH